MADPILVQPGDSKFFSVTYQDGGDATVKAALESSWKHFNRIDPATGMNYYIWYRDTDQKGNVLVDYMMPDNSPLGLYRVETFVPGKYATTHKAVFTIANNVRQEDGVPKYDDTLSVVDMYSVSDVWVPLGEFLLDPKTDPLSGRVRQYNMSQEDPAASVSFAPVRWVPLVTDTSSDGGIITTQAGPRFDAPIGTQVERNGPFTEGLIRAGLGPIWFGSWFDATPYLTWYFMGYHTGADLNLSTAPAADRDAPIFATADGIVIYAGGAGTWGNIIVIKHPGALVHLPSGTSQRQPVISRYGHVSSNILVAKGDQVPRGKNIGFIGLAAGMTTGWHLHFDISYSKLLESRPAHWPNLTKIKALKAKGDEKSREYLNAQADVQKEVLANYIDPLKFLKDNHGDTMQRALAPQSGRPTRTFRIP